MNDQTLATVLGLLYTAAGRNLGDAERVVWREALHDVRDDLALEAARTIVREVDLWQHPPTPASFRQVTRQVAVRTDDRWALSEGGGGRTSPDKAREHLAELRSVLHEKPILKQVPDVYPLPHVTYGERDFCPEEDHSKCGSGPITAPEEG